jgi:hypothetical protein
MLEDTEATTEGAAADVAEDAVGDPANAVPEPRVIVNIGNVSLMPETAETQPTDSADGDEPALILTPPPPFVTVLVKFQDRWGNEIERRIYSLALEADGRTEPLILSDMARMS